MPIYHVGVASVAASADNRWIDNLLSRFHLPGVERARQGIARRISTEGIRHVVVIRWLTQDLGLSIPAAVSLAGRMLSASEGDQDGQGRVAIAPGIELRVDRDRLAREVDLLVADAAEAVVPARRGRPPRRDGGDVKRRMK